jgi:insulysin
MIIHSDSIKFSTVALDIKVGSFQEPINGLAHLLEHVIFLENEKYKEKSYLDTFLAINNGFSNAYKI